MPQLYPAENEPQDDPLDPVFEEIKKSPPPMKYEYKFENKENAQIIDFPDEITKKSYAASLMQPNTPFGQDMTLTSEKMNPIKAFQEEDKLKVTKPKIYPPPPPEKLKPFHFQVKLEHLSTLPRHIGKQIMYSPIPDFAGLQKLTLLKIKEGILGAMYPKFELRVKETNRLILTAKKRAGNLTGNYMITLDHENLDIKSDGYLGKLRCDFWKNTYTIYDFGENPNRTKDSTKVRENLGTILYEGSWFESGGPRKMTVILPQIVETEGESKLIHCVAYTVFLGIFH